MNAAVHVIGGGSQHRLLCQLTANACGLPVIAGPVEATAMGNILVQARAAGEVASLREMRDLRRSVEQRASASDARYDPLARVRHIGR